MYLKNIEMNDFLNKVIFQNINERSYFNILLQINDFFIFKQLTQVRWI